MTLVFPHRNLQGFVMHMVLSKCTEGFFSISAVLMNPEWRCLCELKGALRLLSKKNDISGERER